MPVDASALKAFADTETATLDKQRADAINDLVLGFGWERLKAEAYWTSFQSMTPPYSFPVLVPQDSSEFWERKIYSEYRSMLARGGLPFMPKLKVGENLVALEAELPKDTEDPNHNLRKQFVARLPGNAERFAWNVNPQSPLYRDLLKYLPQAPCLVKIVRVGEQKNDTRYTVIFERRIEDGTPQK